MEDRIVRLKEVAEITGLSNSTIRRRIKDGSFPAGFKLGPRARGWRLSEIEEWMRNLPRAA